MSGTPGAGRRARLLLVAGVVLLVGLSGCLDSTGTGDTDDVLYPNGPDDASGQPATADATGAAEGAASDAVAGQVSPGEAATEPSTSTDEPSDTPTSTPESESDAAADAGDGGDGSAGSGGGSDGSSSADDDTATTTPPTTGTETSTFVVAATSDAELTYRFTVDGEAEKTMAEDGTAADADDQVTESDDGTTAVVGSTGGSAGDAYLVDGEITGFERTGGEGGFELYLDGEDVTDDLAGGGDGSDGGSAGGAGDGGDEPLPHTDSTFDIRYSQTITANGDGTTTVSGEMAPVEGLEGQSWEDIVVVVEIYDDQGEWIASEWDVVGAVGPNRTSYSVTFDVPRDEIGDFRADPNRYLAAEHEGDEHYNAPGQCVEIRGDGPNDEEAEPVGHDVIGHDGGTVVVGEILNGADEHDMAFVRVFVSVYDESGNRLATETTLVEDVPQGEFASFAVSFDETGVADARVDADEVAIRGGELVCRPPL